MHQCPHCQQPITPGIKFCGSCGAPVSQPARRRSIRWRPILITLSVLLVLGSAGFLYFLQVTHEIVLWVEKMGPGEEKAVDVANGFFRQLKAGNFETACDYNENGRDWCLKNEVPHWRQLLNSGDTMTAVYAWKANEGRRGATYTVVAKLNAAGAPDRAYWLQIAPDSPEPPLVTGPYEGRGYEQQLLKRLLK